MPTSTTDWLLDAKAASTAISPNRQEVYSFDLAGRPISWFSQGKAYKRSLASNVFGRKTIGGKRRRWQLSNAEALIQFERVLSWAKALRETQPENSISGRLEHILAWTPESLLAERERFNAVYQPISILPPDQYQVVVLQATFGCSWNRCTFCNFYQNRPFSTKSPEAFAQHVRGVAELLGPAENLRRSIFLADGNALILANHKLKPLIQIAKKQFPGRDIYGFVDVFSGEKKPVQDWTQLHELGLRRVYIGLETGHDPLLEWMNKPGSQEQALNFIYSLKHAGLQVSIIIMVGAGGDVFAKAHEEDTLKLIAQLPLVKGDIIYLSPFVEHPESLYAQKAAEISMRQLTEAERDAQFLTFREGIHQSKTTARVALYHIQEFIY